MAKIIELPCNVGDSVYWFWCDYEGNPEGAIQEETIKYFYITNEGIGISTEIHDGHLGIYTGEGVLVNDILRMFLNRTNAENYIKNNSSLDNKYKHCKDCKNNDLEIKEFNNHNQICLEGRCMFCKYLGEEDCSEWKKR